MGNTGHAPDVSLLEAGDALTAPSDSWYYTLVTKPYFAIKLMIGLVPWLYWIREALCKPRITKFFQDLRSHPPPFPTERLKIGVAGFCWGGYYTVYLCRDEPGTRVTTPGSQETLPLVDCGFTCHPSFLTVPKDIEGIRVPISVGNGEADQFLGKKNMLILKSILEGKEDQDHEVVIYEGARHGFAVRGDPHDPKQVELGARAEDQAANWWNRQFNA